MVEDLTPGKVDFEETRRREDDTNSLPLLADFLSWHECRACDCCGKYFQGRVTNFMPRHLKQGQTLHALLLALLLSAINFGTSHVAGWQLKDIVELSGSRCMGFITRVIPAARLKKALTERNMIPQVSN